MIDDKTASTRSWLERLSYALLREPQDREQLITLLRDAQQRQLLDEHALGMIEGVLQVSEMQVRDIMIPRPQMVVITEKNTSKELLSIVIDSGHSRFPVIGDHRDEVIGILLAKDLIPSLSKNNIQEIKIRDISRPVLFVPESKRLDMLLQEFRLKHHHMAIVIDEYGGIAGLVTIEDVLEQIVGEIEDEHDIDEEGFIKKHSETSYILKAITPLDEFNHYFKMNLNDNEFNTIGGLVLKEFGHLPKRGESIIINNFRFRVLRADNRRIHLLRLTLKHPDIRKNS